MLACYAPLVARVRPRFLVPSLPATASVELQLHRLGLLEALAAATGGVMYASDLQTLANTHPSQTVREKAQTILAGNL